MKVYIAGAISGVKDYNAAEFERVESMLREQGDEPFNPLRNDAKMGVKPKDCVYGSKGNARRRVLKSDLNYICDHAEKVVVLPNSGKSKGVAAEVATARALGIPVVFLRDKSTANTKFEQVAERELA
jgi:precorrin-6x reductase